MGKYISGVLGIILATLVLYLTYDNNRLEGIVSDYNIRSIQASEEVRRKEIKQQGEVLNAQSKADEAQQRESLRILELASLRQRLSTPPRCNDADSRGDYVTWLIGVYNEAANSPGLPPSPNSLKPEKEMDAATLIRNPIGSYNQCVIRLNSCMDVLNSLECVVK